MSHLFNEEMASQLKDALKDLVNPVEIVTFVEEGKPLCKETAEMMEQLAGLNEKLTFKKYDLVSDAEKAKEYGIDKVPGTTFLLKDKPNGVKFYGIPGGHEINSFLFALIESSDGRVNLEKEVADYIMGVDKKVDIKVFVGLQCPHCPQAVMIAQKAAMLNENISAEMIQADLFQELSMSHGVRSVPHTFFNDKENILGAPTMKAFIDKLTSL